MKRLVLVSGCFICVIIITFLIMNILILTGIAYESPKAIPSWDQLQERLAARMPEDFKNPIKVRILIDEALEDTSGTSPAWQKIRIYYLREFADDMRRQEFLRSLEYNGQKSLKLR